MRADHEEELGDLTCVAKLTDRGDRALKTVHGMSSRSLKRELENGSVSPFSTSDVERLQPECFRLSSFRV